MSRDWEKRGSWWNINTPSAVISVLPNFTPKETVRALTWLGSQSEFINSFVFFLLSLHPINQRLHQHRSSLQHSEAGLLPSINLSLNKERKREKGKERCLGQGHSLTSGNRPSPKQSQDTVQAKTSTAVPSAVTLPPIFWRTGFLSACLMSAACHSQVGLYSVKSPLHTPWALLYPLHFKNLGSFRVNNDSGFFFTVHFDELCFSYWMYWSTLKTHTWLSGHGACRGRRHVLCRARAGAQEGP